MTWTPVEQLLVVGLSPDTESTQAPTQYVPTVAIETNAFSGELPLGAKLPTGSVVSCVSAVDISEFVER